MKNGTTATLLNFRVLWNEISRRRISFLIVPAGVNLCAVTKNIDQSKISIRHNKVRKDIRETSQGVQITSLFWLWAPEFLVGEQAKAMSHWKNKDSREKWLCTCRTPGELPATIRPQVDLWQSCQTNVGTVYVRNISKVLRPLIYMTVRATKYPTLVCGHP